MEVTNFDERNIRYFARAYCCNQAPFEDLVQEGWLAALQAKKPEHKYLAVRRAVQTYTRRARFVIPIEEPPEKSEESREIQMIQDLDHLKSLISKAKLTEKEAKAIHLVYFDEESALDRVYGSGRQIPHKDVQSHARAMTKLRKVAREEERKNV